MSLAGLEPLAPGRPRIGSVLMLYAVRLRRRWVAELMAVLGIAAGVALLYAASVASTSLSAPVRSLNEGLVGNSQLQLLARGGTTIPEDAYNKITALPGVKRAAPILEVPGSVGGPRASRGVTFFGADPRVVRLRGDLLRGFSGADAAHQEALVLPTHVANAIGVKFGDDINLEVGGRRLVVPVAVAGRDQIGTLVQTSIALLPLRYLQRLAQKDAQVSRILVEAKPGQIQQVGAGLRRLLPNAADVRPADYDSRLFDKAAQPTNQATLAFSVLAALIGWLFAACALLVTAGDRRKMVIQQHAQGVPPGARLVTLLVDALVVGIVGTVLGLIAGELLSRHGFSSDVSFLSGAFPIGDRRIVTPQSIVIASAGGLLAATIGVLLPLRDVVASTLPARLRRSTASHDGHGVATRHARKSSSLPIVAAVLLAAATAITIAAPELVMLGLVLLGLALVAILPATLTATIAALAWWNRHGPRQSSSAELALQNLATARWRPRALAITATGAVAVFGATALQGARANLQDGLDDLTSGLTQTADFWAAPNGAGSSIGTAQFSPDAAASLSRLPAVDRVSLYRAGLLDIAGYRAWVIGQPNDVRNPIPPHQTIHGSAKLATTQVRGGQAASVSKALADKLGLRVGQTFTLAAPHPIRLRVAAITTNLGWSAGAIVINSDAFRRAWGNDAIAAYQFHVRPGASPQAARAQITQALGPRSALRVESGSERGDRQRTISHAGLARLRQIATLTLVVAILAMGAAMTGLLWQHRPLIAGLKAHGPPTSLMWRMLLIETGVLFGAGALTGAAFGLIGQVLGTQGVQVVTGFPAFEQLRLGIALTTVALVTGASLLVVAIPGYLVARVRPAWRH